jgi:hypothetical protein
VWRDLPVTIHGRLFDHGAVVFENDGRAVAHLGGCEVFIFILAEQADYQGGEEA